MNTRGLAYALEQAGIIRPQDNRLWRELTTAERESYLERARAFQERQGLPTTHGYIIPVARELYFWDRHERDQLIGKVNLSK